MLTNEENSIPNKAILV